MTNPSTLPLLRIHQLSVVRDETSILRKVSWTVNRHEHWVILGPNGSGKSSLLSALAGYLTPTEGSCHVLGNEFGECDWRDLRAHLGIVSATVAMMVPADEPAAYTVLTGRDGGIGLWGDPTADAFAEARRFLHKVELHGLEERRWEVLSQGEKQRVLIARALIRQPALLILDEPCAGLDPVARESFLGFLERLLAKPNGPAVVLVTHHVEEIIPGFTHGLLISNGTVEAAGPLSDIMRSDVLSAGFASPVRVHKRERRYRLELPPRPAGKRTIIG
jgi:iron complex transport system ATP-binding protein